VRSPQYRCARIGSASNQMAPVLSADELTIFFASSAPKERGPADIFTARRTTKQDAQELAGAKPRLGAACAGCPPPGDSLFDHVSPLPGYTGTRGMRRPSRFAR
jgi:hypothetical protein